MQIIMWIRSVAIWKNNVKHFYFGLLYCGLLSSDTFADGVTNPQADYLNTIKRNETRGLVEADTDDTLYTWTADIVDHSKPIVFVTLKAAYKFERHEGQVPAWAAYVPRPGLPGYSAPDLDEPQIDPKMAYVGQITQLGRPGIVTIQIDRPRREAAVAYIYAYTIEGNGMKRTKLAQYDPDKEKNSIYQQYLTEEKRTKIKLQEIPP